MGAPRAVIDGARLARAGALRLIDGLERLLSLPSDTIPPRWIRRHTGPLALIEKAADDTAALVQSMHLVPHGAAVLDAGCGYGVMAPFLRNLFGPSGSYVGFDIYPPGIVWAQRHIAAGDPCCRFVLSREPIASFPAPNSSVDFVLAKSLFTHLVPGSAAHALHEIHRVLRPNGRAFVTGFLFELASAPTETFPYPESRSATVRWRVRVRPQAAIAYERVCLSRLVEQAGLEIATFRPGFYPGRDRLDAQDVLVLSRQR